MAGWDFEGDWDVGIPMWRSGLSRATLLSFPWHWRISNFI